MSERAVLPPRAWIAPDRRLRILVWPVHATWMSAFVAGRHDYVIPTSAQGVAEPSEVDVVVLQRPEDLAEAPKWVANDPPMIYVEHNTPDAKPHPVADRTDIRLVHVTHFNEVMWDSGRAPTTVIEHGVADLGHRYTGELPRAATVIEEPLRQARITGTDLLSRFAPVDVFGVRGDGLDLPGVRPQGDLRPDQLHAELARRRVYVHPPRWTSLGLPLIEAMHLGMPVVVLAATEAIEAVPSDAGVVSTRVDVLADAARELINAPDLAAELGKQARQAALTRYGLDAFLRDWDWLLAETVGPG
ncbi:glycosyltransferase [Kutzneria sp. 744]|uniref:glycosyltransferase n=1 Tax=Kutzneria sp. (strain 744) TaxID=345341 RepID=UPI0003EEAD06|nr:glycosyltransferase [Kutzneria sp. 744]EWM10766.1 glycosyltransferase, group 1 [Kutzneria sp. 744]